MRLQTHGVSYQVDVQGAGPPLLLLHGFTGAGVAWAPHLPAFARQYRTLSIDLLGHGESDAPEDPDRYRMERCIEDLVALLDRLAIHRTHVLGYSMGGRVALHLAAAHPDRIGALILESASPGIAGAIPRDARRRHDDELADFIEREGIERFIDHWERLPLFANQEGLPQEIRRAVRNQRLQNRPRGLANSLRGMGTGVQPPLHRHLDRISTPTILLAGALDRKFVRIARAMGESLPRAEVAIVPEAGHTVHVERPKEFERLAHHFLASQGG